MLMQVKVDMMKSVTGIREMMNIADDCLSELFLSVKWEVMMSNMIYV